MLTCGIAIGFTPLYIWRLRPQPRIAVSLESVSFPIAELQNLGLRDASNVGGFVVIDSQASRDIRERGFRPLATVGISNRFKVGIFLLQGFASGPGVKGSHPITTEVGVTSTLLTNGAVQLVLEPSVQRVIPRHPTEENRSLISTVNWATTVTAELHLDETLVTIIGPAPIAEDSKRASVELLFATIADVKR